MASVATPQTAPEAPASYPDHRRRRGMLFLGLASACVGFTIMVQLGLNDNFLVQELDFTAGQKGVLEAVRESCGIIAFALLALMAGLSEPIIGALMLVLFGVGLASFSIVPDLGWVLVASLVWSQGLHIWMPLPGSMVLSLAEPGQAGRRLGQIASANAIGSMAGLLGALALALLVPIRPIYLVGGAAALVGAGACLGIPRDIKTPGPRLVFRSKYSIYYLLCFLEGWRKQIFIAFAGFLLVSKYHTPLWAMLLLWTASQGINWFFAPKAGRLVDRVGERPVLMFYFASLTVVFCGYAFVRDPRVLYALFIIDNAFYVFSLALTTYVRRIAPPSEHTPTLSMGVAMNHVAAVSMPLVGGLLWTLVGYQWVFLAGAAATALSILAAMRVPRQEPAPVITAPARV